MLLSPELPAQTASRVWARELEKTLCQDRGFLVRLARAQLRDDQTAEDVVQETAMAAWQSVDKFEGRSSIRTWLVGILRFKILDAMRQRQRHPVLYSPLAVDQELASLDAGLLFDEQGCWSEMPEAWLHGSDEPAEALQQSQMMQFLMLCLKNLPEKTSTVFLMREYLGLDSTEITAQTGLKAGHVRIVLMRARLALRTCLAWRVSS